MNLLLDTHVLIWALNEDQRLSEKAKELILDPDNAIYYSSISIWEVAIKHAIHPENVTFTGKELSQYCQEAGFLPVEMRDRHVLRWKQSPVQTMLRNTTTPLIGCLLPRPKRRICLF